MSPVTSHDGWNPLEEVEPVPCDLPPRAPFGGSFPCATPDVRRRGTLAPYTD